ncbi:MAG: hypothetical protein V1776_02570 [Candidatus Diapherotrites archaeon]
MHADITYKVPKGKLLRLSLEYDTTILHHCKMCGDFFIHPEETIHEMEHALYRLPVEASESRIRELLDRAVERKGAQLIGINTESIAKLIHEAIVQ